MGKRYNRNNMSGTMQNYIFELQNVLPKSGSSPVSSHGGMLSYFEEFRAVAFPRDR